MKGGERQEVCVLKVELNEVWNLRGRGESRMASCFGKRTNKGEKRNKSEVNQQVGLGNVKFQMIPGHPDGGNLQPAGQQRVGSGSKMGLDH